MKLLAIALVVLVCSGANASDGRKEIEDAVKLADSGMDHVLKYGGDVYPSEHKGCIRRADTDLDDGLDEIVVAASPKASSKLKSLVLLLLSDDLDEASKRKIARDLNDLAVAEEIVAENLNNAEVTVLMSFLAHYDRHSLREISKLVGLKKTFGDYYVREILRDRLCNAVGQTCMDRKRISPEKFARLMSDSNSLTPHAVKAIFDHLKHNGEPAINFEVKKMISEAYAGYKLKKSLVRETGGSKNADYKFALLMDKKISFMRSSLRNICGFSRDGESRSHNKWTCPVAMEKYVNSCKVMEKVCPGSMASCTGSVHLDNVEFSRICKDKTKIKNFDGKEFYQIVREYRNIGDHQKFLENESRYEFHSRMEKLETVKGVLEGALSVAKMAAFSPLGFGAGIAASAVMAAIEETAVQTWTKSKYDPWRILKKTTASAASTAASTAVLKVASVDICEKFGKAGA